MKNLFVLICLLVILSCAHKKQELKSISILADIKYDPWSEECFIPKKWLIKKVPIKEMNNNYGKNISWQRLKPLILKKDEIWYFDSPRKYWHNLAGRRGYAIVRNGKPIGGFFTELN